MDTFRLVLSTMVYSVAECTECFRPILCIKSLNEWASRTAGVKYTETILGRECAYCMHTLSEMKDIERNSTLEYISFWYYFDDATAACGHSAIEIVFGYRQKYIVAVFEGFEDNRRHGLVSCHQFHGNKSDIGAVYLKQRAIKSTKFIALIRHNFIGDAISYRDTFDGPIKEINNIYVKLPYYRSQVVDGKIILNNGCLWYAINLYAALTQISVHDLLQNPNISEPIIRFKTRAS